MLIIQGKEEEDAGDPIGASHNCLDEKDHRGVKPPDVAPGLTYNSASGED